MYTQCPDCDTVFRVSADMLRAAQGMVRCGVCSTGFNALENLSEQPLLRLSDDDLVDDTITVEETPGTEFIELSAGSDQEASTAPAADADADADSGEFVVPGGDDGDDFDGIPDTALEFHGSPADVERLFVQDGLPASRIAVSAGLRPVQLDAEMDRIAAADLSGIEVREEDLPWPQSAPASPGGDDLAQVVAALAGSSSRGQARQAPDDDAARDDSQEDEPPPLLLIPEELRRGPSATAAEELASVPGLEAAPARRRWPGVLLVVVLGFVLLVQAAHHWREELARDPVAGPWILRAYGMLGLELPAPVDLGAFELRQLGAASEPSQSGRIKVRASIVNRAAFAQPYPLLRLTLQDRFGAAIGVRDLNPAEYLPGGAQDASRLLGPGERADAEVVFVDPGREAVGFELDVCIRGAAGLRCSADLPRAAQSR